MKPLTNSLLDCLDDMKSLMETEQRALMTQNGEALESIARSKAEATMILNGLLEKYKSEPPQEEKAKTRIRDAVQEIRALQETNTLLARQTLVYLGALKEALKPQKSSQSTSLYARSGEVQYGQSAKTGWLDQSV
ncbi:hypothetical protein [Acidaminobacter hydrogenoformans]|uniref:FlgN protein n=1 Tax=Acidaminobacter hydrogenoformans DSM 2784 TaxID=1120920 RepID=A0A1G5RVS5_9FIRM|nr:hypothetical protein [Acidaminobacter hydrogenoformans]SCZ77830.1 hypothetical protein SAMN03080599_00968 [Acidaminobacter hydrogenoformans DSM 2784]